MELNSSPNMEPNQRFSTDSSAHFTTNHYSFPSTAGHFTIDQNLDIGEGYTSHTASNITSRVNSGGDIASNSDSLTHDSAHPVPSADAQRNNSTVDLRKDSYDAQGVGLISENSKRKRSKVSRACDQCRRKKIRCDADADGTLLKTCSHCLKAGQTCDFSRIPQKRGPSKGYIKELSERVQQVEGQLALQYSPGLRSSIDGGGSGAFGEHAFSPEDEDNLRRPPSFSLQRSPFADFSRDRMPSIGGWNITSNPQPARERDRTSIAIPPDQQYPGFVQPQNKSFWVEFPESPAKRRKILHEGIVSISIVPNDLDVYYDQVYSHVPILTDAISTSAILNDATPVYQHAFVHMLTKLSHTGELESATSDNTKLVSGNIFTTQNKIEEFLNSESVELSSGRNNVDNLVLTWTYALQAMNSDSNVLLWKQTSLSKLRSLTIALNLIRDYLRDHESHGEQRQDLKSHWFRAWHCIALVSRLQALGFAEDDPSPETKYLHILNRPRESLPHMTAYLSYAAGYLDRIADLNAEVLCDPSAGRTLEKLRMQAHLRELSDILDVSDLDPLVQETNQFIRLLTVRVGTPANSTDIAGLVSSFASTLNKRLSGTENVMLRHDLLSPHTCTLVTLTLLELIVSEHPKKSELDEVLTLQKETLKTIEKHQTSEATQPGVPIKGNQVHWADVLLHMIETRTKEKETNGVIATSDLATAVPSSLDFGMLIRKGYFNVLVEYANSLGTEPS